MATKNYDLLQKTMQDIKERKHNESGDCSYGKISIGDIHLRTRLRFTN